ncbi:MAG: 4-hydroxy-tetrahydrodipicolinate synthase family protein [Miltoncostaeaceae bacterium]
MLGAVLTAAVTPFDESGGVDEAAYRTLVRRLLDSGSDGIVVAGTTGEASTLSDVERIALFEATREETGGRGTMVAGTGSNDTAHSVHLTQVAAELGADAVLVVTPYYNKPPAEGIRRHVAAIAEVGVPVVLYNIPVNSGFDIHPVLYNIPGRTALNMEPALIADLAAIPGVVALKQANDDLSQLEQVMDACDLAIYAGNDDMLMPVLEMGGTGVISVASHLVGSAMQQMVALAAAGDLDGARAIDTSLAPLWSGLFEVTNPILIKAALAMCGMIPTDHLRLPLVSATPGERERLAALLGDHGITGGS